MEEEKVWIANDEQALKALSAVKDYVKEKFPMMAAKVDKLFEGGEKKEEDYLD